jgi:uncharacterized membrane protein
MKLALMLLALASCRTVVEVRCECPAAPAPTVIQQPLYQWTDPHIFDGNPLREFMLTDGGWPFVGTIPCSNSANQTGPLK